MMNLILGLAMMASAVPAALYVMRLGFPIGSVDAWFGFVSLLVRLDPAVHHFWSLALIWVAAVPSLGMLAAFKGILSFAVKRGSVPSVAAPRKATPEVLGPLAEEPSQDEQADLSEKEEDDKTPLSEELLREHKREERRLTRARSRAEKASARGMHKGVSGSRVVKSLGTSTGVVLATLVAVIAASLLAVRLFLGRLFNWSHGVRRDVAYIMQNHEVQAAAGPGQGLIRQKKSGKLGAWISDVLHEARARVRKTGARVSDDEVEPMDIIFSEVSREGKDKQIASSAEAVMEWYTVWTQAGISKRTGKMADEARRIYGSMSETDREEVIDFLGGSGLVALTEMRAVATGRGRSAAGGARVEKAVAMQQPDIEELLEREGGSDIANDCPTINDEAGAEGSDSGPPVDGEISTQDAPEGMDLDDYTPWAGDGEEDDFEPYEAAGSEERSDDVVLGLKEEGSEPEDSRKPIGKLPDFDEGGEDDDTFDWEKSTSIDEAAAELSARDKERPRSVDEPEVKVEDNLGGGNVDDDGPDLSFLEEVEDENMVTVVDDTEESPDGRDDDEEYQPVSEALEDVGNEEFANLGGIEIEDDINDGGRAQDWRAEETEDLPLSPEVLNEPVDEQVEEGKTVERLVGPSSIEDPNEDIGEDDDPPLEGEIGLLEISEKKGDDRASTEVSEAVVDQTIGAMDKAWLDKVVGESSHSQSRERAELKKLGLEDLGEFHPLLPALWTQIHRVIEFQSQAYGWEHLGDPPPEEFDSEEKRRAFLMKAGTAILALREQLPDELLQKVLALKGESEEGKWLGGRADRMMQDLMHGGAVNDSLNGGGDDSDEAGNGGFVEHHFRDAWRLKAPIAGAYREHAIASKVPSYKSPPINAMPGGQEDPDHYDMIDVIVGDLRPREREDGRQPAVVGINIAIFPKGEWCLEEVDDPGELEDRFVLRETDGKPSRRLRIGDRSLQIFEAWCQSKGLRGLPVVHVICEEGAVVEGGEGSEEITARLQEKLGERTGFEFRFEAWSDQEWVDHVEPEIAG